MLVELFNVTSLQFEGSSASGVSRDKTILLSSAGLLPTPLRGVGGVKPGTGR